MLVINQPAGLGDILFLEPLVRYLGKHVFPIEDSFFWIAEHLPQVNAIKKSECKADLNNPTNPETLNLRWANQIYRGYGWDDHHDYENMMIDKYRLVGLDPMRWKDLQIKRNPAREQKLLQYLNLPKEFVLVNNFSRAGNLSIKPDTDLPVIYMRELQGFTLIDWMAVMERATENHHVSTSTFFLFEVLKLKTPIHLYARPNEDGLRGVRKLCQSFDYIPHE